jgi:hypothetical protein
MTIIFFVVRYFFLGFLALAFLKGFYGIIGDTLGPFGEAVDMMSAIASNWMTQETYAIIQNVIRLAFTFMAYKFIMTFLR